MKRIKIEDSTCISKLDHSDTEHLKRALRISQQQGLIQRTGDPSLDAPLNEQEPNAKPLPKNQ